MTQSEKLQKLIQKAIDGGFKGKGLLSPPSSQFIVDPREIPLLIFNHDFARALFGEEPEYGIRRYSSSAGEITRQDAGMFIPWKLHLQQAVISDDPIGYMYDAAFSE